MKKGGVTLFIIFSFVSGCAELPRPATFPLTSQEQFQSATHWQAVARRLVWERLVIDQDVLEIVKPGSAPRIYVQTFEGAIESPFDRAFRNYLITELKKANFLLADANNAPVHINWDLQLVSRDPARLKPQGFPERVVESVWEFLTGARWTTRGPLVSHTEAILTTRVTVGEDSPGRIVKSYSDTFYINDGDLDNYQMAGNFISNGSHPRSIAAQDEAWKRRLARQGLLSQ